MRKLEWTLNRRTVVGLGRPKRLHRQAQSGFVNCIRYLDVRCFLYFDDVTEMKIFLPLIFVSRKYVIHQVKQLKLTLLPCLFSKLSNLIYSSNDLCLVFLA